MIWRSIPGWSNDGASHPAIQGGELFLGHLLAAQKWIECVHQEHLDTVKLGEDVHLHFGAAFVYSDAQQNVARPFAQILTVRLSPPLQRLFLGSGEPRCNALSTGSRPLIRRKPTFVFAVLFVMLLSNFTQKTPVPSGTGKVRNLLIPRSGSEWNRKVPNATLLGVECHSSSGSRQQRLRKRKNYSPSAVLTRRNDYGDCSRMGT